MIWENGIKTCIISYKKINKMLKKEKKRMLYKNDSFT